MRMMEAQMDDFKDDEIADDLMKDPSIVISRVEVHTRFYFFEHNKAKLCMPL